MRSKRTQQNSDSWNDEDEIAPPPMKPTVVNDDNHAANLSRIFPKSVNLNNDTPKNASLDLFQDMFFFLKFGYLVVGAILQ